jgi:hypothetical protein
MGTEQGADELRMKAILKTRGVGPDAPPPVVPPKPTGRPRDWLDDILDTKPAPRPAVASTPTPKPAPAPAATAGPVAKTTPKPPARKAKKRRKKPKRPGPDTPRSAFDDRPQSPRQSLLDAWGAVPYRLKWLAYHAAAGYLGWAIGLVDWVTYVTSWIATTGLLGGQAFFWYGAATCTFLVYRRTREAWLPVAWLAAVPATSTVAGVLLYGTPHP